jgi:hypothetical protein
MQALGLRYRLLRASTRNDDDHELDEHRARERPSEAPELAIHRGQLPADFAKFDGHGVEPAIDAVKPPIHSLESMVDSGESTLHCVEPLIDARHRIAHALIRPTRPFHWQFKAAEATDSPRRGVGSTCVCDCRRASRHPRRPRPAAVRAASTSDGDRGVRTGSVPDMGESVGGLHSCRMGRSTSVLGQWVHRARKRTLDGSKSTSPRQASRSCTTELGPGGAEPTSIT